MPATGMQALKESGVPFAEIARRIGITRGAIYQWDRVPAERLGQISSITGIPPERLRPDLFEGATGHGEPQRAATLDTNDVDRVATAGLEGGPTSSRPAPFGEMRE